jgi:IPT/TIG domain
MSGTTAQHGDAGSANAAAIIPPIPPVPDVASFSPTAGAIGMTVTIEGFFFINVIGVKFGDTNAQTFDVVSEQKITAVVPPGAHTGPISVVTFRGIGTSQASFVVVTARPHIDSITPDAAPPGTKLEIAGTQLLGATSVQFGGLSVPFKAISERQINVKVPAVPPGQLTIVVYNALGFSNPYPFTITAS